MNWKNKKVLITGAEGFIGSHLVEKLLRKGAKVRAFVLYNSFNSWGWLDTFSKERLKKIEIFLGDVRNTQSVYRATKGIDITFHLAALVGIPFSYHSQDMYVDTNIKGTLNILQAAREHSIEKVIHTSTSEVYGTAQYIPIDEKHPVNPQSPYAATKASADYLALSFYRSFNLPVAVVRPFNTFGPRQSARAVIPTIISQIISGKKVLRLGNVATTRDFNYVGNTVDAFIAVAQTMKTAGQIYNAGTNREISIEEAVTIIASALRRRVRIEREKSRMRPQASEVMRLKCDYEKIRATCGWLPAVSFEEGIEITCRWFKGNLAKYKTNMYNI
jgi:NAD dependent epimerase/dehydratase